MKRTLSTVEYEDGEKQSIIKSSEQFSSYEFDNQDITLVYDDDDIETNNINKKQNIEKILKEKKKLPYFLQLLMDNSKYLDNIPSTINNNNDNIKCFYCEIKLDNNNNNEVTKCVKCDRYTCHLKSGCSMLDKYNNLYCLECIQNQ